MTCLKCRGVTRSLRLPVDMSSLWLGERVETLDIDLCEACGGAWFDRDEWPRYRDRRLGHAPPHKILEPRVREAQDRRIAACPRCGIFLETKRVNGSRADVCPRCMGIWFDGSEFPAGPRAPWRERIIRFLRLAQ